MFLKFSEILFPMDRGILRIQYIIASCWRECVGVNIADKTHIGRLRNNVLFVNTENSVWASHLTAMKREILSRLNEKLQPYELKDIRFVAKYPWHSKKEEPLKEVVLSPTDEECKFAAHIASFVSDEKLKNSIYSLCLQDRMSKRG